MTRIAVVGANGQVGAELCLLLAREPSIELVAVCRNRSGSAFLRWQGIACRHGRVADTVDAARLIGDCDLVVNSSLATGTPAEIRRTEDTIVRNLFAYSASTASIIHFSTQSVYGDPRAGARVRWRNPYGRAKLATEARVREEQRRTRKAAYILRLGHVCGPLQEISIAIRESIRANAVVLPDRDRSSNTVYTHAIASAVLQIARREVERGTYDLMNSPPWTWREVYEFEAQMCGEALQVRISSAPRRPSIRGRVTAAVLGGLNAEASIPWVVQFGTQLFAYIPASINDRAMAWWQVRRARREIAALHPTPVAAEHLSWVQNGVRFFPAATPTRELLCAADARTSLSPPGDRWPDDLPDAVRGD